MAEGYIEDGYGYIRPGGDDDAYVLVAQVRRSGDEGNGQYHGYFLGGDDMIELAFANIDRFSHGHHVYGEGHDGFEVSRNYRQGEFGRDVFHFSGLDQVKATVVGRIDDFDPTRDEIWIEGAPLDLENPPENVNIVAFHGAHNDPGADPQQWLLIDTGGGFIFYALEGARVDMNGNGGANGGLQEAHFLAERDLPEELWILPEIAFTDPQNIIPEAYKTDPRNVIIDQDKSPGNLGWKAQKAENPNYLVQEVQRIITGTDSGDLIAAGLNDDFIRAGAGDDVIWGGTGHDTLEGGAGNDLLIGGRGADVYVFGAGFGEDQIEGFEPLRDTIRVQMSPIAWAQFVASAESLQGNILLTAAGGSTLTIEGLEMEDFSPELIQLWPIE